MPYVRFRSGILGAIFALAWANLAGAQPATAALEELGVLADTASTVIVTDRDGRELRGTIANASGSLLSLRRGRVIYDFQIEEVRSVRVRKEDPLGNGAVIGALVGGGSVAPIFLDNECRDDPMCYASVGVWAGVGALAGLGLDALVRDEVVVYPAAPRPSQALRVGPIGGRGRKGVRLTIAF